MSNNRSKQKKPPRRLSIARASSLRGFEFYLWRHRFYDRHLRKFEAELCERPMPFSIPGFCYVCGEQSKFYVDALHAHQQGVKLFPNFRERLLCKKCGLSTRLRASIHVFERECWPNVRSEIYLTEQTTPFYRLLHSRFPQLIGSEYLGRKIPLGSKTEDGIRNESLLTLTFGNAAFDFILCFDVFEHIPEFERGFTECARCLKPGGRMLFSVPFVTTSQHNILRARVRGDGEIEYLVPPEFHGDILRDAGCLCFHHFGWEMLSILRKTGFAHAYACVYWSRDYAYLGGPQLLFVAGKAI